MKKIVYILLTVATALIVHSCANKTAPTGGPKDETPPKLIKSNPTQGQTLFNELELKLEFDEYIKTNQPKQEIIITPTIQQEYEVKARKNSINLIFEEPLDDSTTYTINFREAIQDITESNSPENLKIAFSTGPFLDSMSINGKVLDLKTQVPQDDILVGLYALTDTLNVLLDKPTYFTKTSEDGIFNIDNIKIGAYKLLAFKDVNKNLTPQTSSESHGFIVDTVFLDSPIDSLEIFVQNLNADTLQLSRTRQVATTFQIKYNKPLIDYQVTTFDSVNQIVTNFMDDDQETVLIYNSFPIIDSIPIFINAIDSIDQNKLDTLFLLFKETTRKPSEFNVKQQQDKINTNIKTFSSTISFSKPISTINFDSLYLYIDSLHIYPIDSSHLTWNPFNDLATINYLLPDSIFQTPNENNESVSSSQSTPPETDSTQTSLPPDQDPHFYAAASTFISTELDSSSSIKKPLDFITPESLGTIQFSVQTEQSCYYIQLLDDQYQIVQELYKPTDVTLNNLSPREYRIRIIIDDNCNEQWDFGNILTNTPPETIIMYTTPDGNEKIVLRANWEYPLGTVQF